MTNLRVCVCVCDRVTVYANGTLHISQVKQRSTGVYKCVAQYGENKHVHVDAALRIAGETTHTHIQSCTHTHTLAYTLSHTHNTHKFSFAHTDKLITHSHTYSLAHTPLTHSHTHTHCFAHTHTLT